MASIIDFRRDVHLYIAQVPDVVIDRTAYRVLNDFLVRSEVYRTEITPVAYEAASETYDLTTSAPADTQLVKVVSIRYTPPGGPDERLPFATKQQLDVVHPDWMTATGTKPIYWTLENPYEVRLYPIGPVTPVAGAVAGTIALTIPENVQTIPDWLYNRYSEWILPGIYSRLFLMPQREWSDAALGASFAQLYEEKIKMGKTESDADQGRPMRATSYGGL